MASGFRSMVSNLPPLPEGFVLEESETTPKGAPQLPPDAPPLPPGFQFESTPQEKPNPALGPTSQSRPTLDQRAQEVYGIDPNLDRATILPLARNAQGNVEWALPQMVVDPLKSMLLPGHVAQGGEYTTEDVTRMALDTAPVGRTVTKPLPPTARAAKDALRKGRSLESLPPMSMGQLRRVAPAAGDMAKFSGKIFEDLSKRGIRVSSKSYDDFVSSVWKGAQEKGLSEKLTPDASAMIDEFVARSGDDVDFKTLRELDEMLKSVKGSKNPRDAAIGMLIQEKLDEYISTLGAPGTVHAGDATDVAPLLKKAKGYWGRYRKLGDLKEMMVRADSSPSGLENGLRQEFRAILRNKNKRKLWTADEQKAMKAVVDGGPVRYAFRVLGKAGFGGKGGNDWLGGTVGTFGGYSAAEAMAPGAGVFGAVAVPATGRLAKRLAEAGTKRAAENVSAVAAAGGKAPQARFNQTLPRAGTVGVGALMQPGSFVRDENGVLRQIGPNGGLIINGVETH